MAQVLEGSKELGKKVQEQRIRVGMKQSALATKLGVSRKTVNRLEKRGQLPPIPLDRVAMALSVEPGVKVDAESNNGTLGSRIREQREKRGMTQEELVALLGKRPGVNCTAVSEWEHDKKLPTISLSRLADILKVSDEYLETGDGNTFLAKVARGMGLYSSALAQHLQFAKVVTNNGTKLVIQAANGAVAVLQRTDVKLKIQTIASSIIGHKVDVEVQKEPVQDEVQFTPVPPDSESMTIEDKTIAVWKEFAASMKFKTQLQGISRGRLTVNVPNSVVLHELTYNKKLYIDQMNIRLGEPYVIDIVFRVAAPSTFTDNIETVWEEVLETVSPKLKIYMNKVKPVGIKDGVLIIDCGTDTGLATHLNAGLQRDAIEAIVSNITGEPLKLRIHSGPAPQVPRESVDLPELKPIAKLIPETTRGRTLERLQQKADSTKEAEPKEPSVWETKTAITDVRKEIVSLKEQKREVLAKIKGLNQAILADTGIEPRQLLKQKKTMVSDVARLRDEELAIDASMDILSKRLTTLTEQLKSASQVGFKEKRARLVVMQAELITMMEAITVKAVAIAKYESDLLDMVSPE